MILKIIKNPTKASNYGAMFGQDVEPYGTYVLEKDFDGAPIAPWIEGSAEIKNPLIIDITSDTQISYKYDLANQYKAKGKNLTKKLMGKGYDAIITKYPNGDSGEIVLFQNCRFLLHPINENKILIKNLLRESLLNENTSVVAYHGSETKINKFLDDFVGGKEAKDQNGPGIYFTSSWNNARSYGGYVYTVNLSPQKILSNKKGENAPIKEIEWLIKKAPNWKDTAQNWDENPMRALKIILNDFIKYNDNPNDQFQQVWIDFYRDNPVDYVRNMVQLGYDALVISDMNSIITQEENIIHTIVFNPAIIQMVKMEDDTENI